MDSIIDLFNTVLKIAFFGGIFLFITNILKFRKYSGVKTDIVNMQAKISQLRLALKGKVKKKANVLRGSFKGALAHGDMVDNALRELADNNFENGEDFQNYFDSSRKIINFINIQNEGDAAVNASPDKNFMSGDFKTEMDIVRIIKEMSSLSSKVNSRIDDYNRINQNQKMPKLDSLIFPSLAEISRIYNEDENVSESTTSEVDSTTKAS